MILYLDASALVKRYVAEPGSDEVSRLIAGAAVVGTSLITRAETSAALAKAARVGALTREAAAAALQVFRSEWPFLIRVQATELVLTRADTLAWELGLRGYDAVHLASASIWQEGMGEAVTLATFDRQLWDAARTQGLAVSLENLGTFVAGR
ncbi:MAG: type II toxin-antitoxin system VapC family toxin [Anaerolineae bacterium]|jgi:predicted nucleic acid-binding protein|nr:type II toxin-antitoxin system VapC family toxin [Anaerolineae bacterium]